MHWPTQLRLRRLRLQVALKGDVPIGVDPRSSDTWYFRRFFKLDTQSGAPPDDFCLHTVFSGIPFAGAADAAYRRLHGTHNGGGHEGLEEKLPGGKSKMQPVPPLPNFVLRAERCSRAGFCHQTVLGLPSGICPAQHPTVRTGISRPTTGMRSLPTGSAGGRIGFAGWRAPSMPSASTMSSASSASAFCSCCGTERTMQCSLDFAFAHSLPAEPRNILAHQLLALHLLCTRAVTAKGARTPKVLLSSPRQSPSRCVPHGRAYPLRQSQARTSSSRSILPCPPHRSGRSPPMPAVAYTRTSAQVPASHALSLSAVESATTTAVSPVRA